MANVLQRHIAKNNLSVVITGKSYVMVEGWQFAGGLLGLFPRIVKVENIGTGKWLAQAEIISKKTGQVASTGFAICSKEEAKKRTFDEYAVLSMAQTRAIGKAYRNLIGWIIKMSGHEGTPAEEMPKGKGEEKAKTQTTLFPSATGGVNYLEQVKDRLRKLGAKTEPQALKILHERTGLVWKNFKASSSKQAQLALAALIQSK